MNICKFSVEIERKTPDKIFEVMRLIDELYGDNKKGYYFVITPNEQNEIKYLEIKTRYYSNGEFNTYPVDVTTPLIKYRMLLLPKADTTPHDMFDDLSFKHTFTITCDEKGIKIAPTYIPLGK